METTMATALITCAQRASLIANGERRGEDHRPVVKLFTPDANATWLLTELDSDGVAFGLCDLGHGFPELGTVCLLELASVRGPLGLPVERDLYWHACAPVSVYADAARAASRIVEPA
jgi:hypothetical protein